MKTVTPIVRKELRSYFLSPVALIFVATFLLACLFSFFWIEGFFSRNVADIRPLFRWLPVLLIFLVPALGMRLWSEEERTGSFELLRSMPLPTWSLVLGKFLAGLALVAVALGLTFPVPLMVSTLGNLDWGPVFGGYLATILVAGAYLAITLCVSAITTTQLVALVVGSAACGTLYVLGSDQIAGLFSSATAEVLRGIGAGARFESVLRGVIDLRDMVYYGSIIGFGLLLNGLLISIRSWSDSSKGLSRRRNAVLAVVLVGANLAALNVLLAPVRGARLDLTEAREYSISPVTRDLLQGLNEPLMIRGYFTAKTHPLLAPLVPRIRDLIEEYGSVGGRLVQSEFIDPTADPDLEKEANQDFGITSVPFQFADRHESSVVNSYFHILVKYGDQFETLSFDDLIEVTVHGMDIEVRLRNLEYDLTRAVQKVVHGFQSLESIAARLPAPAKLRVVLTPNALPEGFGEVPVRIKKVAEEMSTRLGDRFSYVVMDPEADGTTPEALLAEFGIKPYAASLFSAEVFYMHMLLEVGDRVEQIIPPESMTEADIRKELEAGLKRSGPGSLRTLGLVSGGVPDPSGRSAGPHYQTLNQMLSQSYNVEDIQLSSGRVPGNVDVLLVLGPEGLTEPAIFALDQFLMRGGRVVLGAGHFHVDPMARDALRTKPVVSGLDPWLEAMGVEVRKGVVMDPQNARFPIRVTRDLGGFQLPEIQMIPYPPFVDVRSDGMAGDNPALAGLPAAYVYFSSPIVLKEGEAATGFVPLLSSSADSWVLGAGFDAQPDFQSHPEMGWPVEGERGPQVLAASRVGTFKSFFAGKGAPGAAAGQGTQAPVLEESPEDARLVVLGSASLVDDVLLEISRSASDGHLVNLQLMNNLVDWSLEDVELLRIRSRGTVARALRPTTLQQRQALEWGNYLFAVIAVVLIGGLSVGRRRRVTPLSLPPRAGDSVSEPESKKGAA